MTRCIKLYAIIDYLMKLYKIISKKEAIEKKTGKGDI